MLEIGAELKYRFGSHRAATGRERRAEVSQAGNAFLERLTLPRRSLPVAALWSQCELCYQTGVIRG
ncbi:MAG TPA: hypothetical protein VGQ81_09290 [Acidobacteriota bacterium]|nr:hypothetical protein [Acidobacteriota bacterium]